MPVLAAERTERFMVMLEWFEANGPVTMRQRDIAAELGVPYNTFCAHLGRAIELGLIRHVAGTSAWGKGRSPGTYRLVVKPAEWLERREQTIKREQSKRATEKRKASRARQQGREQLAVLAEIQGLVDALEGPDPILARVEAEVLGEAEVDDMVMVDAWLAGNF